MVGQQQPQSVARYPKRAAQYVRMSTEHQKYSIHNQAAVIAEYGFVHGLTIVRTYADHGKSGLNFERRPALKQLIADVQSGEADFDTILVYDVSRWGRFQDNDESAYYEFICTKAGIAVRYCAEQFENDGSLNSTIFKNIKRVMAAEFSRELSAKVFRAQSRLVSLGYRQGGLPGYGLRRFLVDERGNPRGVLEQGERKALQTDRTILVPGPPKEVAVIRKIFRLFVTKRKPEAAIAKILNAAGETNPAGRPWKRCAIHRVLTSEKYIGNNVYNRRSAKLTGRAVNNPPDQWVRSDGAFEPTVSEQLFEAAQTRFTKSTKWLSDREILLRLIALLERKGRLSAKIIEADQGVPSPSTYSHRFGSLVRTYELIGYRGGRDYGYRDSDGAVRNLLENLRAEVIARVKRAGATVHKGAHWNVLVINDDVTLYVGIARRIYWNAPSVRRWRVSADRIRQVDLFLIGRTTASNNGIEDYYLVPSGKIRSRAYFWLTERRRFELNQYRHDTLEFVADLAGGGRPEPICKRVG